MARTCSTCGHEQREEIEKALISGKPLLRIARDFGIAESSLRRHRDLHLSRQIARAFEEREEINAEKLVAWTTGLHSRTLRLLVVAETEKDLANARGLISEARKNVELIGRLAGILDPSTHVHIDARRQLAILGNMNESDLRALAAGVRELEAVTA